MMHTDKDIVKMAGQKVALTTTDMTDRTASYTIPQIASNNVVINITGGCEYCKAGKRIIDHAGSFSNFHVCCDMRDDKLDIVYDYCGEEDEYFTGHKAMKINYCPMCGRKLEVEG
jgi:hypothetical protein